MIPLALGSGRPSAVLSGILLWLSLCGPAQAVITFERTYPSLGANYRVCALLDQGSLVCGGGNDSCRCLAEVFRTDSVGDVVWRRQYGPPYPYDAYAHSVCRTLDGCYAFGGLWTGPDADAFVAKTDTLGNLLWTYLYDGSPESVDANCNAICATLDSGIAVTGFLCLRTSNETELRKLSKDGELEWVKVYSEDIIDGGQSVLQTRDLGYLISGTGPHPTRPGRCAAVLVKADPAGDTVWTSRFDGFEATVASNVVQTQDGGYVQCGNTPWGVGELGSFVWKLDSVGNEQWRRTFVHSGPIRFGFRCIASTPDGGCAVVGVWIDYSTPFPYTWLAYLLRFDSLGETLWSRKFDGFDDTLFDDAYWVESTPDRGLTIVGVADASWPYLIKTDSLGLVYAGIEETMNDERGARSQGATVVRGMLFMPSGVRAYGNTPLLDAAGRKVMELGPGVNDIRHLPPGVYFVREASGTGHEASGVRKVVLAR